MTSTCDKRNERSSGTRRWLAVLVVSACALVYLSALSGGFVYDDTLQIVLNERLHSWDSLPRAFTADVWDFQEDFTPSPEYRPFFLVYLTLCYQLFGLAPLWWHLLSIGAHAAVSVMVFRLSLRLGAGVWASVLAALLFAVHPVHVESVAWISGITDPLAALFFIPALTGFVRYRQEGARKWLALSLASYALSLLCKETAIVLPLVLFVWDVARDASQSLSQRLKRTALACAPYIAVTALYAAARLLALGWLGAQTKSASGAQVFLSAPYLLAAHLRLLVAPLGLSTNYGSYTISSVGDARFLVSVCVLVALAFCVYLLRRRFDTGCWIALALTIAPLLPVLNVAIFHPQDPVHDRYLYLPSVGFCFIVSRIALRQSKTLVVALCPALLIAFGSLTVRQNRVWRDETSLWERAVEVSPESTWAHANMADAYARRGMYAEALDEYMAVVRLDGRDAHAYSLAAQMWLRLGDAERAEAMLRRARSTAPRDAAAAALLGTVLMSRGDLKGARENLEAARLLATHSEEMAYVRRSLEVLEKAEARR
jgi:protein O-mannosyl-transferase